MSKWVPSKQGAVRRMAGFTAVELLIAAVIFPIVVIGIADTYNALNRSYKIARQLNDIYAVLSACPEIDRALEFSSIGSSTNCYPNNTFNVEHGRTGQITYAPTVSVVDTSALSSGDPLKLVPDTKVVNIDVAIPSLSTTPHLQLKMLITRNGIGQL